MWEPCGTLCPHDRHGGDARGHDRPRRGELGGSPGRAWARLSVQMPVPALQEPGQGVGRGRGFRRGTRLPATSADRLRAPGVGHASGLVAYLDGEPAGWCAVEPRTAYVRLGRVPWAGRAEDKTDDGIWAVTCFVTRAGFRHRGVSRALARATVDFARQRGVRALESYPMITQPGQEITWDELCVGSRSIFADAGFAEVSHPTPRRVVMRIDF